MVRDLDRVPVGKPLTGVTMDVLDQDLKPCPPGDVGELCIGGTGVANGYLNLPDAQAGKFVDGGTRYRTGDLARLTPDGDVVLVGRSDSLVKIRGFRVETSAVELALKSFDDVEHAVVKAFGNEANEKSLVAFYTTWSGQEIGTGELIAQLADSLPEHMIPSDFHAARSDRRRTSTERSTGPHCTTRAPGRRKIPEQKRSNACRTPSKRSFCRCGATSSAVTTIRSPTRSSGTAAIPCTS